MTIRYEAIVNTIIVQILKRDVNEEYAYPGLDMETLKQAVQTALEVGIEMGVGATLALSNIDGEQMPWLIQYEILNAFCQWELFKQECTDKALTAHLSWLASFDPAKIRNIQAVRRPVTP